MSTQETLIRRLRRPTLADLNLLWIEHLEQQYGSHWYYFIRDEDYVLAIKEGSSSTRGWHSIAALSLEWLYRNNWTMTELFKELPKDRVIELYWISKVFHHAIEEGMFEVD